jgi:rfaE bifunctional protein nucleotidyltransferase chain/domain
MAQPSPGRGGNQKIVSLDELAELVRKHRDVGERIVHCHGVFDLVHPGHIRHLESAAEHGDVLVVTVVADHHVRKGPNGPVFNQRLRAETLAALECVDYVALNESFTAVDAIERIAPDVYVQGAGSTRHDEDATARLALERDAVQRAGGQLALTDEIAFSSTHLLNAHFDVLSPEATAHLQDISQRWSAAEVIDALKSLRDLRVLVIGDAIVDEYHFCNAFGKASKSSAISAQYVRAETYAGGALAVANHVAGFCDRVTLVTCLGELDSREEFVRAHLKPNIELRPVFRPDAPTTVKRRFVESFLLTKFFEVSFFNDSPLPPGAEGRALHQLDGLASGYDLVLVADFGHGLMTARVVERVCADARHLAVNTQLNSINFGYNVVTKYPRVDYACIDEQETRMAARDRFAPLPELVKSLTERLGCKLMATTRGKHGSLLYAPGEGFSSAPVLSREVVDTIGAGDAFLAVTAPCVCAGLPADLIGFVGNAVGALAVRIIGNKESVEPDALFRYVRTLLTR